MSNEKPHNFGAEYKYIKADNNEIVDTESLIEWGVRPKWDKLILEANKQ